MRNKTFHVASVALAVGLFLTTQVIAQDTDWRFYGGNQWNERHATLTKITKGNVAHLVPRRVLQLGQVGTSLSASPLVIDGILYVSAPDGSDPLAPDGWWGDFVAKTAYGQEMSHRDLAQEKADREKYAES